MPEYKIYVQDTRALGGSGGELPIATRTTLGTVKIGPNLMIDPTGLLDVDLNDVVINAVSITPEELEKILK